MRQINVFTDFLHKILGKKSSVNINFETYRCMEQAIGIEAYALYTVIDLIASLTAKCKFAVYDQTGKPLKSDMYVLLNIKPNKNQTAYEFWREAVAKLLYHGEVLMLQKNDQLLIADYYEKEEFVLKDCVFSDVKRGDFTFRGKYTAGNVLYMRCRTTNMKMLINSIYTTYEKLLETAIGKYHRSGKEKGILEVSAMAKGNPDFEDDFAELMDTYFRNYFGPDNAVLPLFDGYTYKPGTAESTKKYSNEITDIVKLFEESQARAAQMFRVPIALVRGDVASIKDNYDIMLSNCIDPVARIITNEFSGKFYTFDELAKGAGIVAMTKNIKHVDVFSVATGSDKLISSGAVSINELREEIGYNRIAEEWADQNYITKNYATAGGSAFDDNNNNEGGENNNANNDDQTGSQTE